MIDEQQALAIWLIVMFYAAIFIAYDELCHEENVNKIEDILDQLIGHTR
ncbi:MAG: hypothetical protein KIT59_01155 [Nitrosomonas sp.]|nr:hypothetical protein [Nitrosomonas sp.]